MSQESYNTSLLESPPSFESTKISSNLRKFKDIDYKFTDEKLIYFVSELADEIEDRGGVLNKHDFRLIFNQVIKKPLHHNVALKILNEYKQKISDAAFL